MKVSAAIYLAVAALTLSGCHSPQQVEELAVFEMLEQAYEAEEAGQNETAIALAEQAVLRTKRLLGENHPDTLESKGELGYMYLEQGRFEKAEPVLLRTFELRTSVLGDKHPDTLRSMDDLATLLRRDGRHKEAEPVYLELIELSVETLGK